MKKTYLSPSICVVPLNCHSHLLTGSPGIGTNGGPADKDLDVLSRRGGSFWDDEGEE